MKELLNTRSNPSEVSVGHRQKSELVCRPEQPTVVSPAVSSGSFQMARRPLLPPLLGQIGLHDLVLKDGGHHPPPPSVGRH